MSDDKRIRSKRGHHEGGLYQRKDGKWCAALSLGYGADGRRKRRVFLADSKQAAKDKLLKAQQKVAHGESVESNRIRVGECVDAWLKSIAKNIEANTYRSYESAARVHIHSNEIAQERIINVQPARVQMFYSSMEDKKKSGRVRENVHFVLQSAFDHAVRMGYVAANPCAKVIKPRRVKRAMRVWDAAQSETFLDYAMHDRFWALYCLAITCGMRQGELFAIKLADINLDKATLAVQRSLVEVSRKIAKATGHEGTIFEKTPKTDSGERSVKLPEIAVTAIRDHLALRMKEGLRNAEYLFCDTDGGPLRKSNFTRRSYLPLIDRAKLPRIRFGDLRHTHATLLLTQGVHPKVVQERLGHANVSITLDVYSHVLPTLQEGAAKEMDVLFTRSPTRRKRIAKR